MVAMAGALDGAFLFAFLEGVSVESSSALRFEGGMMLEGDESSFAQNI